MTTGDWQAVTPLADLLVRAADQAPERLALVLPDEQHSYGALRTRAQETARGLWALGVRPGAHVAVLAPNGPELVAAYFGIATIGAVVVPLNTRHKASELAYIVDHAQCQVVLTTTRVDDHVDLSGVLAEALPGMAAAPDPARLALADAPRLDAVALLDGGAKPGCVDAAHLAALARTVAPEVVERARRGVRVRDVAVILYTSGTTAQPKGCMLTHEALTRGPVRRALGRFSTSATPEVHWCPGPLFHVGALSPFLGCVGAAGTVLTDVHFDAGRAIALMAEHGVTAAWPWFPPFTAAILDHPDFDPSRLRTLRHIGQIGPRRLFEQLRDALPDAEPIKSSGMTETAGPFGLSTPAETFDERVELQGTPIDGVEVRVVDPETGADLPRGVMGELLVRGYCVTEGYYRDPERTAAALDADRWLHTGDLYRQLPDDHLVFHGRLKDMLKVGGENVAALEVEAFLCGHPDVAAAEVVGRPDDRLDEVPVAFVELRPGARLEAEDVIAFCRGAIASYKVPRDVVFVAPGTWPMSATKVDKRELRRRVEAQAAPSP